MTIGPMAPGLPEFDDFGSSRYPPAAPATPGGEDPIGRAFTGRVVTKPAVHFNVIAEAASWLACLTEVPEGKS